VDPLNPDAAWRPAGDCAQAASDAAPITASTMRVGFRHELAKEIQVASARAMRDMVRPSEQP
jgi:hypothetical protein